MTQAKCLGQKYATCNVFVVEICHMRYVRGINNLCHMKCVYVTLCLKQNIVPQECHMKFVCGLKYLARDMFVVSVCHTHNVYA